jgi:uncharacterized iron-regulated protein
MNKYFFRLLVLGAIIIASAASCGKDDGPDGTLTGTDEEYKAVLTSFVDNTIKPTYRALAEAALVMRTANEALKANPSDATMRAASDAWMDARIKWEISEAFLFGPVGEQALDIDGHIDSWPLELEDIKREIAKGTITGREAWQKEGEVIGFHVTEYLLYRDGQTRPVSDLIANPNEFSYLTAATDALVWDCVLAYVAWVGLDNVPAAMKLVFQENPDVAEHLNNNPSYMNFANRLTNATGYPSIAAAMSEIASGAAEIAGEVGAVKIAEPYDEQNTNKVESWYSWHSLDDYTNNILSIKNAYLGGMDNNSRTAVSLSTYIVSKDPKLDESIKAKIEDCIVKIKAIGNNGQYSFYEVVRDQINNSQVQAAERSCDELRLLFEYVRDNIQ